MQHLVVNASNDQITITDHGFVANQEVHYKANGGTAIVGLTDETTFFVKTVASANAFTLSATEGGALIDITGTGNNAQTFLVHQQKHLQLLKRLDHQQTVVHLVQ